MNSRIEMAKRNLGDILREAIQLSAEEKTLVIFDTQSPLSCLLVEAYRLVVPMARFVDFDSVTPGDVFSLIDGLKAGDLVVLVQSTNFRLDEFRLRIELFKRSLKTVEHIHLGRMSEPQIDIYLEALAYDPAYYRPLGRGLKRKLETAQEIVVEGKETRLVYGAGMEIVKLNIGDYSEMKNVGGTFPIGEVFTESKDLHAVNGDALIFAFAGEDHFVRTYEPFRVQIQDGILTAPEAPTEFQTILEKIREDEEVLVREFGLGLNPAMYNKRIVNDITAFERQKGLHLSLGAKHAIYVKPGLSRKKGRYHVDVFVAADRISVDGVALYEQGEFIV